MARAGGGGFFGEQVVVFAVGLPSGRQPPQDVLAGIDARNKGERFRLFKQDPYANALQVKYAYAVTCHKAQGGQWMNVFLDIGYITEEMLGEDFYRWLYTAFTRATHRLYLVNLPEEFEEYASS